MANDKIHLHVHGTRHSVRSIFMGGAAEHLVEHDELRNRPSRGRVLHLWPILTMNIIVPADQSSGIDFQMSSENSLSTACPNSVVRTSAKSATSATVRSERSPSRL